MIEPRDLFVQATILTNTTTLQELYFQTQQPGLICEDYGPTYVQRHALNLRRNLRTQENRARNLN